MIHELASGYDRAKKCPKVTTYRTLTREEVLALGSGMHVAFLANDGTARTLKINGKVRTWKRDPDRVEVPIKYGMYECATFSLEEAMRRLLITVKEGE